MEHGAWEHGNELFEEEIRVPLLVVLPGDRGAGRRSAQPASGIDLLPTVLDLLGVPIPDYVQGRSLAPALDGTDDLERSVYSEGYKRAAAVRRAAWKLVRMSGRRGWRLFDLATDPKELQNLATARPETAREMAAALHTHLRGSAKLGRRFPVQTIERDPEVDAQLRALGYLN
jgi:arylsulfatase A-like enzyme